MTKKKISALFISDVHLGSKVSHAELVVRILEEYLPENIFIVGDLFDDLNLHRLHSDHWDLLAHLRSYSKSHRILLIEGNHDGLLSAVGRLLGIDVVPEFIWPHGGKRYLIIHGHQFDRYVMTKPVITAIASAIYFIAQRCSLRQKQSFARFLKRKSKKYLRLSEEIAPQLAQYAKQKGADSVIFGHTHEPMSRTVDGVHVHNCGCFTDLPSSFITIDNEGLHHHEIT